MTEQNATLQRALGLRDSLAIVIGSVIGTGIFLKTAPMAQGLGSALWVLMAWVAAGALSFLGAITYAELGALFPQSGGGYAYIREAYGRLPAFFAGWVSFWILFPGSIAAYGVASGAFLSGVLPGSIPPSLSAVVFIAFFAALNCLAVSFGGAVQSFLTGIKVLVIVLLALSIFFFTPNPQTSMGLDHVSTGAFTWGAFGAATLAALWAFDGWEAIARVAGEIRNAQRTLPLALVIGICVVLGLYAFANLAYFWALPLSEIVTANSHAHPNALPVATKAVTPFLGETGIQILSAAFVISSLGAMNGCILTSARVPYAMAKDGLFFSYLSRVSSRTRVPVRAIWTQAVVAGVLAASGTFDQLTNYVMFSAWIFYGLTGATVFVFRRKLPNASRAYRVPGYPYTPALLVLMAFALIVSTLIENPIESALGLGLIALGLPFYYALFRRAFRSESSRQ